MRHQGTIYRDLSLSYRDLPGDCIELRTTNLLPEFLEENAFQLRTRTDIVGIMYIW